MRCFISMPLMLCGLLGCQPAVPLPTMEEQIERAETTDSEYEQVRLALMSEDPKLIMDGLTAIQRKPTTFDLYRQEVLALDESTDPRIKREVISILNRMMR